MIRTLAAFSFIFFLSMIFHLILGGDSSFRWQQVVISLNLKDLLIGGLLLGNLLATVMLLRKKPFDA